MTKMLGAPDGQPHAQRMRERRQEAMKRGGFLWRFVKRWEEHAKGMFVPSTLFEELGFHYTGPIDGHDMPLLLQTLTHAEGAQGPAAAARDHHQGQGLRAGRTRADRVPRGRTVRSDQGRGRRKPRPRSRPTPTIFGDWLCDMAAADRAAARRSRRRCAKARVWCASRRNIPQRYFDVGIAEQHAVTLAAGMACEGAKPVVAIYSTFLQRGYDQLIHDVALQNLDVTVRDRPRRRGRSGRRRRTRAAST